MRVAAACLVILLCSPAVAERDRQAEPAGDSEPPALTTARWKEPPVPLDLHWQILAVPETVVELAFTPIALLVTAFERYRLDRRIYDLLRNDAGTIVFTPRVKFSGSDGLGGGGKLSFKRLTTDESKLAFGGIARLNGDYELVSNYEQIVANLEGRAVVVGVEYELDQDLPYYGIGDETDNRHVLLERRLRAGLDVELTGRGTTTIRGIARLGYLRDELTTGVAGGTSIPVEDVPGLEVTLPPGFDATVNYARLELELDIDTRDTEHITSRGILARLIGSGSLSSDDAPTSGGRVIADFDWYWQVLPRKRVLVFSLGAGAAALLGQDDDVPLHELITLGRKDHLRGYSRGRLRDRYGWWTSIEYRYPIWEYQATGASLIPVVFADMGKVAGDFADLASGVVYYDAGFGIRGEHYNHFFFSFELGFSPEGPELGFSLGSDL